MNACQRADDHFFKRIVGDVSRAHWHVFRGSYFRTLMHASISKVHGDYDTRPFCGGYNDDIPKSTSSTFGTRALPQWGCGTPEPLTIAHGDLVA
jgi:hypothetical protein